jgi:DNA excision repair protein ERCC-1
LRVLLVQVDVDDAVAPLQELARLSLFADVTLLVAWSTHEAARYLETLKAYEHKAPTAIQERPEGEFGPRLAETLAAVRGVTRADAATLLRGFGSFAGIVAADEAALGACPGLGPKKIRRLRAALAGPLSVLPLDNAQRVRLGLPPVEAMAVAGAGAGGGDGGGDRGGGDEDD